MLTLALMSLHPSAIAGAPEPIEPLVHKFGDAKQSLGLILWSQFWARFQEMNPGTTVNGVERETATDLGIRRARALVYGRPNRRMFVLTHFGINNQTFNNARKPQLFLHDAWVEGEVVENALSLGVGLHYFNGVSRAASASTMGFLGLDGPIFPWANIETTDQFARQFGFYAKGKLSKLDYRVALNHPFTPSNEITATFNYNPQSVTWASAGYLKLELADPESNLLPFLNGNYMGTKRVINVGAGWYVHPEAMARLDGTEVETADQWIAGTDVYVDTPAGEGAITAYGLYQYSFYGEGYIRNIGIMNIGTGGTSFAGAGNAYPMIGTGHTLYGEFGWLLPAELGTSRLQPYVSSQTSFFDALGAPMVTAEVGANWILSGHNAKITGHYRNRPVFDASGDQQTGRASEFIAQFAFRY